MRSATRCCARRAASRPPSTGSLLYEAHDGALRCTHASGERVAYFRGAAVACDDAAALPARALRAGHRATLRDDGTRPIHPTDEGAVAVPLDTDPSGAAAVVLVATAPLAPDAVDRIVALAELAAPSFLVARDRERDRRTAEFDALTGLLTPRAFRRRLARLVERARATPAASLALLFADTDNFKRWNDTFGHAAGDVLLRRIAAELRGASREHDLAARNGGDEFCVILADTAQGGGRRARRDAARARSRRSTRASARRSASPRFRRTRPRRASCSSVPTPRCITPRRRGATASRTGTPAASWCASQETHADAAGGVRRRGRRSRPMRVDVLPHLKTARFDRLLSYRVPDGLVLRAGDVVRVPLGTREVFGT